MADAAILMAWGPKPGGIEFCRKLTWLRTVPADGGKRRPVRRLDESKSVRVH